MIDVLKSRSKRATYGAIAVLTLVLSMAQGLVPFLSTVSAAQITARSMQVSNSTAAATGVTYKLSFTPATTGAQSMVIDFCLNSPLIGSTCTAPTTFSAASATLTGVAGTDYPTGWSISTPSATNLELTGTALTTAPVAFQIGGITNPAGTPTDASNTYFARVTTYTANAAGNNYASPTSVGTVLDDGSVALSVANNINVTAAVLETLVFCVSGTAPEKGCVNTTTPNVALGHGSPVALDSTAVDTGSAYMQVSSNAVGGVTVYMKNSNACGGLSRNGGTTCDIAPINNATTAAVIGDGNALFGLQVGTGSAATVGTGATAGAIASTAPYNGTGTGTTGTFGMNNLSGATVTSTFGSPIANTAAAPSSNMNSTLTFGASASNTTPAGLYSARMILVAVGTY